MPFSTHADAFEPEHLALLHRVLERICGLSDPAPDDLGRSEIAARLITCFRSGYRDEESLFSRAVAETTQAPAGSIKPKGQKRFSD